MELNSHDSDTKYQMILDAFRSTSMILIMSLVAPRSVLVPKYAHRAKSP